MSKKLDIETVLVASGFHVDIDTSLLLEKEHSTSVGEFGFTLPVTCLSEWEGLTGELKQLADICRLNGCTHLTLDIEGNKVGDVEIFTWPAISKPTKKTE